METVEVIVLGMGAMGSAACYHLARRGIRVLGLEQFAVGHNRGSSHGQTRMIRQAYFEHPDYVPLLKRAYVLWDELNDMSGELLFERIGLILYGPSFDEGILKGVLASALQHTIPIEQLSPSQAIGAYNGYLPPREFSAIFEPGAGCLHVEACVKAHARLARQFGAEIHEGEAITTWTPDGDGVVVTTPTRTYRANRLIITAGAWLPQLLQNVGLALTIHQNRLYWFNAESRYQRLNGLPCFGFDMPDGFFYGFPAMDAYGLKIARHLPGPVLADPTHLEDPLETPDLHSVQTFLKTALPGVKANMPTQTVNCMYTMTPDEHFIVDQHPQMPQVILAGGFSGHGFKFSPVIGEILADLAITGTTPHPAGFLKLRPSILKTIPGR